MMGSLMFLAEGAAPQAGGGGMGMLIPMVLVFGIFYFMMIRPQQRKEKERLKMISELRVGRRVMFAGGFVGTIAEVMDGTFKIEIAPNVIVEVARGAVSNVVTEKAAAEEKK